MTRRFSPLLLGFALALTALLTGCSRDPDEPHRGRPAGDDALAAVALGLSSLDDPDDPVFVSAFATSPLAGEVGDVMKEMDGFVPEVTPGPIVYGEDENLAEGTLHVEWRFPSGAWEYDVVAALRFDGAAWVVDWTPALIHPRLSDATRLVHLRFSARRAGVSSTNGDALIEETTVVRVGIDKTFITQAEWEASARALATRLDLDPDAFAQRVLAAGELAFVEAVTVRQHEVPDILDIPGARGLEGKSLLGPSRGFMAEILGTLREATAEDVESSDGLIVAGDQVGAGGLQKTFDAQLRGRPGDEVYLAPRGNDIGTPTADTILHHQEPEPGQTLEVSFTLADQAKAQAAVGLAGQPAAAVLVRPSDGAILAAAISPELEGRPDATLNHYAPGSTFKIVTALALLRHGYTADTPVECSKTATAGGVTVTNYPGYPGGYNGIISLATAMAQSCNTVFVNQTKVLGDRDLLDAAASLGAGVDYDAGGILYGAVPIPDSEAMKGQMVIGQGGVLMSPVAMAGVVASVAAGHTVVPWMVSSLRPEPDAAPLTADEAAQLQRMLSYTVTDGLASSLRGLAAGAKSGTAEYGEGDPLPTHAWMVAYTDHDLAAAVWVKDGGGSGTAGPIIQALLG